MDTNCQILFVSALLAEINKKPSHEEAKQSVEAHEFN